MPSAATTPSPSAEHLSDETLHRLRRLRRTVASARGIFALFPVESDLSDAAHDESWSYLRTLLAEHGLTLHILSLTESDWNPLSLVEKAGPFHADAVVLLTAFENTPGIADTRQRPQALSALNIDRELLEETVGVPLILWGRPWLIRDLQRHAPDFYDHFSATFCIHEPNEGENNNNRAVTRSVDPPSNSPFISRASTESAIAFYEAELLRHANGSPEYIRAVLGLADALFDLSMLGAGGRNRAEELYQNVLQQSNTVSESTVATVLHQLGMIAQERRQLDAAEHWYRQSLEIEKRIGNEHGEAQTLHQLGRIAEERANLADALPLYEQSARTFERLNDPYSLAIVKRSLSRLADKQKKERKRPPRAKRK